LAAAGMTPSTIRPLRGVLIGICLLVAAGADLVVHGARVFAASEQTCEFEDEQARATLDRDSTAPPEESSSGQFRRVGACPVLRGRVRSKQRPLPLSHKSRRHRSSKSRLPHVSTWGHAHRDRSRWRNPWEQQRRNWDDGALRA